MKAAHCPICQREMRDTGPGSWPQKPFCSPRCRTIDLGRWLNGDYRIPDEAEPTDGEAPLDDTELSPP